VSEGIMRVRVGQISAHCEQCGCFSCGLSTTRRALLMQVSEETVRRAQAFLEASRKARQ
jgi:hypothetical protein